jgi:hypothetical protein
MLNTEKRPFAMRKPYLRLERQVRSALRPMALAVGTSAPGQEESLAKRRLPVFERLLLIKRGCAAPGRRASSSKLSAEYFYKIVRDLGRSFLPASVPSWSPVQRTQQGKAKLGTVDSWGKIKGFD